MLQFKKITLADKSIILKFTLVNKRRNCDLSFVNIYSWNFLYQTEYAIAANALFFRFYADGEVMYMLPVAEKLNRDILTLLLEDARKLNVPFVMAGVCSETVPILEQLMPDAFIITADRDYADYIYLKEDLLSLSGKNYQPKRNHINQFKKQYPDYIYSELTPELVPECLQLEEQWYINHEMHYLKALQVERKSMSRALQHMNELDIQGGVLRVKGKIIAFTYGAPINNNVFDVCVEKADTTYEGAYPMINHEFVSHIPEQYIYINREEDLGVEGLRQSKMSYHPFLLLEKCIARLK